METSTLQQIRALEADLGVVLLHRSTRKLSLTEAGASLYEPVKHMVKAAEEARENVAELRDGLLGSLRIATTPMLARNHIVPALSTWLNKHSDLSLRLYTSNQMVDMIDERVDVSIYFSPEQKDIGVPLMRVKQILVASKEYLQKSEPITDAKSLNEHNFIGFGDTNEISLSLGNDKETIKICPRFLTNDSELAITLAKQEYGIVMVNEFDVKECLVEGSLVQVLPQYQLPMLALYGKTLSKEQQPAKVWRCLEVLTEYFSSQS